MVSRFFAGCVAILAVSMVLLTAFRGPIHEEGFNFKPADNAAEFQALIANPNVDIIRSVEDFKAACSRRGSVYAKLSAETVKIFMDGLKFREGGISTARYDVIQQELPQAAFIDFWGGFGISGKMLGNTDYINQKCVKRATCEVNHSGWVCTHNC